MTINGITTIFSQLSECRRKLGCGPPGAWLPTGGATGTVLSKTSPADYDTNWASVISLLTAGNGIVFAGTTIHFAQAGVYTAGAIPFATTGATMGFDAANLFWDNTNKYLGIGIGAAPTSPLHINRAWAVAATRYGLTLAWTTSLSGGDKLGIACSGTTLIGGVVAFNAGRLSGGVVSFVHEGDGTVSGLGRLVGLEVYHGRGTSAGTGGLGGGAVGASMGLYVQTINLVAGTITDSYDIYIPTPAPPGTTTTNYAIYQVNPNAFSKFFGHLDVGSLTPPLHDYDIIRCEATYNTLSHPTGVTAILGFTSGGDTAEWSAAGWFENTSSGTINFSNTAAVMGVAASAIHNGTVGICTGVIGIRAWAQKLNTGVVSTLTGGLFGIKNSGASGAVTTGYGIFVSTPIVTSAITTNYQCYLQTGAGSAGASFYGLYQAGVNDSNFFAGLLAVGTASVVTNATFRVQRSFVVAGNIYGCWSSVTQTAAAASAFFHYGMTGIMTTAGGQNYTINILTDEATTGVYGQAIHSGTGTNTGIAGVRGYALKSGAGVVASAKGVSALCANTAANALTIAYSFWGSTPVNSGGGTIGTFYGLYLSAGAGTTVYGVAQVGTADLNYFAGHTAFGTAIPLTDTYALFAVHTTGISSLRVVPGAAILAAPVSGDIWSDGVDLWWQDAGGTTRKLNP